MEKTRTDPVRNYVNICMIIICILVNMQLSQAFHTNLHMNMIHVNLLKKYILSTPDKNNFTKDIQGIAGQELDTDQPYLFLGAISYINKDFETAIQYYGATKQDPWVLIRLGDAYYRIGELELAKESWVKTGEFNSMINELISQYENQAPNISNVQKITELKKILAIAPANTRGRLDLAGIFWEQSRWDDAKSELTALLPLLEPDSFDYLFSLGRISYIEQDYIGAANAFMRAKQLRPDFSWTYLHLADIYTNLEKYDLALRELLIVMDQNPEWGLIDEKVAGLKLIQKQYQESITYYEQALLHGQYNPSIFANTARANTYLGMSEDAIMNWKTAISLEPTNEDYSQELATLYLRADNQLKACLLFNQFGSKWSIDSSTSRYFSSCNSYNR